VDDYQQTCAPGRDPRRIGALLRDERRRCLKIGKAAQSSISRQVRPERTLVGCSAVMSDPRRASSSNAFTSIHCRPRV
jgi:hypothetical protein